MTLRKKTLLLLAISLAVLLLVLYAASTRILLNGFKQTENEGTRRVVQGVNSLFAESALQMKGFWADWSEWDESYEFVSDGNAEFREDNLNDDSLNTVKIDFIAFVRRDGKLVFGTAFDQKLKQKIPVPDALKSRLKLGDVLLRHSSSKSSFAGIFMLPRGPMLIISRPIIPTDGKGPIRGTLLVGRYLDAGNIERVSQVSSLKVTLLPFNQAQFPPDASIARSALNEISQPKPTSRLDVAAMSDDSIFVRPLNLDTVVGYAIMRDVYGVPAVMLRVSTQREFYLQGLYTLRLFFLFLGITCVVFSVLTLLMMEKLVLARLMTLSGGVSSIRASRDLAARVREQGEDELSQLAGNINGMLGALQTSSDKQRESEEMYREMSQIARSASDVLFVFTPRGDAMFEYSKIEYSNKVGTPEVGTMVHSVETVMPDSTFQWHGDVDALLGYGPGEFEHSFDAWMASIHPDDCQRVRVAYRASCLNGDFNEEYRVRCKNGSYLYWLTRGKPLLGEDGRVQKFIGACTDISERKSGEEALRSSEERLSRIIETNADAIIITDENGRVTAANAAAETIFGLSRTHITQRAHDDAAWKITDIHGAPFPADRLPFARVQSQSHAVYDIEYSIERPDGQRVVISTNAAPLLDAEGRVGGMVASVSDVTHRKKLEERLAHQAFHDALTGLPNRKLFLDRLEAALARAKRDDTSVAVLFLDLDNFKFINDSFGHAVGDQLLQAVAARLLDCLRITDSSARLSQDTAARFGGDEFTLLLSGLSGVSRAVQIAERVLKAMEQPFLLNLQEVTITPSIGISFSLHGEGVADEILRNADTAMYDAKNRGRARYELFQASMSEATLRHLELQNDLRRAIERNELTLWYQPQVDISSGQTIGVESLARWQHPKHGLVPPLEFIPLAEESGQIAMLGHWVLREACLQACRWQQHFPHRAPLEVSVNLSVKQLRNTDLVGAVQSVLDETGLDPHLLVLEITESVIMSEAEEALTLLHSLKQLGVRLAIDDFGTGYSSLAYLQSFPIDILKIDRRFVSGLGQNSSNTNGDTASGEVVIVSAMINLAHALGLATVAEGVETPEELQQLKQLGSEMAQGYLFSKPLPAPEITAFLHREAPSIK